MTGSLRSFAKRLGAPFLAPIDRRLADFTAHERTELARLDERMEIDLRVLDEHLLAMQRVSRRVEVASSSPFADVAAELAAAIDSERPAVLVVTTRGAELALPADAEIDVELAFRVSDGTCTTSDVSDEGATLRVVRAHTP